jgi:hypothetical protein
MDADVPFAMNGNAASFAVWHYSSNSESCSTAREVKGFRRSVKSSCDTT